MIIYSIIEFINNNNNKEEIKESLIPLIENKYNRQINNKKIKIKTDIDY